MKENLEKLIQMRGFCELINIGVTPRESIKCYA